MSESIPIDGFRLVSPELKYVADVVVYRVGKYAVAKDKYGNLIAQGDDHGEVIQKAIDNSYGGKLLIMNGEYDCEGSEINIIDDIVIQGEDMTNTIIKRASIIKNKNIETKGAISNLTLDGDGKVDMLLNLANYSKFTLYRLYLKNSNKFGLYWAKSPVKVIESIFENCGLQGYDMAAGSNPYDDDYALFAFNKFTYSINTGGGGFLTSGSSEDIVVIKNKFYDKYGIKYAPISFENGYGSISRVIVDGNIFYNAGSTVKTANVGNKPDENFCGSAIIKNNIFVGYGINVKGFRRFIIDGNIFYECAGHAILVDMTDVAFGRIRNNIIINPQTVSNSWPNNVTIYIYDFQGVIDISGNTIADIRSTPKMVHGIVLSEARSLGVYKSVAKYNVIIGGTGDAIQTVSNVDASILDNITDMSMSLNGKMYANGGTATFTGDGTTTQFKISHNLVAEPSRVVVTPKGSTPAPSSIDWDATYIYINYSTAPASGTTLTFSWIAEV